MVRSVAAAILIAIFSLLALSAQGNASILHPDVVTEDPINVTPNVEDDSEVANAAVHAFARVGDTIFAGGAFHTVTDASGSVVYDRRNIMSFDAVSGSVSAFAPDINGTVWALARKENVLFVGGDFNTVNGQSRRGLVKLDATTGAVKPKFDPGFASGNVTELKFVGDKLIVGGSFPGKLAAIGTRTGKTLDYIKPKVSGRVAENSGPTKIYRFAINPARTRLVAIGNFTTVGGKSREQAFMLRLGDNKAVLSDWYYAPLRNSCSAAQTPVYLRDVDFSPNGGYFVMVATGFIPNSGGLDRDICDAAARFETDIVKPSAPTWINYTGGDTLHSVAATGAAVYVQGHQRWLDNKFGFDDPGPGAVERPGIGAINPQTGLALSWNPTKTRDIGGKDFMATATGLWVGSDGGQFAGEHRAGIAFVPLP